MRFLPYLAFSLTLILGAGQAGAEEIRLASADLGRYAASPDNLVASTIQDIRASKPDAALASVDRLIAMRPDFKLAYLIKGDLLQAKAGTLAGFGGVTSKSKNPAALNDFKDEARARLMRYLDQPEPGTLPRQILQLAPSQRYALLADSSRSRLYVFENDNGEPRLIRDFYLSVGRNGVNKRSEGDMKTPSGVYTMTTPKARKQLTDFYGEGAYPLDYPNDWDRLRGNTGHGIWLHGVPSNTYSRPPKSSEGCLVVANPDYKEISQYIQPNNTPIVIAERTEWLNHADWLAARQDILGAVETWKDAWQRLDADAYLSHYTGDFLNRAGLGWTESKRRNIVQKGWIRVGLSDISLFLHPADDLAVLSFTQAYDSDKHSDITRKRIYLKQDQGRWRIALEKSLQTAPALASNN